MAQNPNQCAVCLWDGDGFQMYGIVSDQDALQVSCPRCHSYRLDRECYVAPKILDGKRHLLSGYIRSRNLAGNANYLVHRSSYTEIADQIPQDHRGKTMLLLKFIYNLADGTPRQVRLHPDTECSVAYCYDTREFVGLMNDLKDDSLLEMHGGAREEGGWKVRLKTKGLDVVTGYRQLGENQMARTQNNYFNANVGVFQTGDYATAKLNQNSGICLDELRQLLEQVHLLAVANLPATQSQEITSLVHATAEEIRTGRGNEPMIRKSLTRICEIARNSESPIKFGERILQYLPLLTNLLRSQMQ